MKEHTKEDKPEFVGPHNRVLSYLPLSHSAGLVADIISQLLNGSAIYFARPDVFAKATLLDSLKWCRPTCFMAVPRIYEKFEEGLLAAAA